MENTFLDKMREKFNKNPKFFLAIGLSILAVGVLIIGFFVVHNQLHDRKITVTNIDKYVGKMPNSKKEEIYETIFQAAETNSNYDEVTLSAATATIRDKTFSESYDSYNKVYSGDFVVDIESIKQTYHIYYDWTPNKDKEQTVLSSYGTTANCPTKTEMIYDFYKCKNPYVGEETSAYEYRRMLLPYAGELSDGTAFSASSVEYYYGSGEPFVRVSVDACGNSAKLEEGVKAFKNYLKSYDLNPEDYKIISKNSCDGGAL